jgi:hypothetical protein
MGNGGNAQSRLDEGASGEGRTPFKGAVELRKSKGLPSGDFLPPLGVLGEVLREGDALTGVN